MQRIAVLESRMDRHEKLMEQFTSQVLNLQASVDKLLVKMEFVDKLEAMDASVTALVKIGKATLYLVGTVATGIAAFKVGDVETLKSLVGALAP